MTQKDDDFADFEAEDEFEETWDEETLDDEEQFDADDSLNDDTNMSSESGKKSFVKPLIFLLATCGVLGAGGYAYMNMDKSASLPALPVISFDPETLAEAPASQNNVSETSAPIEALDNNAPLEETVVEDTTDPAPVLTPLPGNIDQEPVNLPDLFAEPQEVEASPDLDLAVLQEDDADISVLEEPVSDSTDLQDPLEILQEDELFSKTEISPDGEEETAPKEPVSELPEAVEAEENDPLDLDFAIVDTPAPTAPEPVSEPDTSADQDNMLDEIQDLQLEITQETVAPEPIEQKPAVEPEIAPKAEEKPNEEAKTAKAPKEKIIAKKPTVKPKKVLPKASWSMKSAQPGRAVLRDRNTGETRSVEINNIINGLGRIKSIQKVNGKWLVKGTLGSVHQ